ncbi:concanavalin A-like lectin/glucanase superfamily protein [Krasilnikovia cinnamomea]|uniref:Concanavalin A-like lectin/glucanase superfamily protein n=1 Tax=Krasilnikovia cinnamomea TaxID=349313 RepID=A0A4Q7ZLC8_9ACTN|nr:LamG-like jellyroll fold domain-containing protein [Krasilnikovia cinnamomea]RZU51772.1 concanavalin A-like lectin/glucanase superfamily protein [Krasilnikovia cinnamomea]
MRYHSYTLATAMTAGLIAPVLAAAPAQAQLPMPARAPGSAPSPAAAPAPPGGPGAGALIARYDFENNPAIDDSGNGHNLRIVARNRGTVRATPHANGHAVAFPAKCRGGRCPQVVLQTRSAASLNPGPLPLAFGATVLLTPTQTSKGQNIVQKGYSRTSSQYKLQIDGAAGRPSCVLVGVQRPRIRMVRSRVSVADGRWHTLECQRRGRWLRIIVDGVVQGRRPVPVTLAIANWSPLSIGGKGAYHDNDQFHGSVDDVWVRIG